MTEALSKIYKASSDYIGDASLTTLQQQALKTKSLCLPLLADNPFEKGQNEDAEIERICLEYLGLPAIPRRNVDAEARRRYDNLTVQYSRNMNYLRELINHTFFREIYHTSSKQAKLEFKEVQRIHHNNEAEALLQNANHITVKFTAKNIIDHITAHCTCANDRAVQTIQSTIDKNIRYKGQSLLDWYQLFIPIVNKYQKAAGKANLSADEQKAVWKDHFVKQVNLAELVLMISVRAVHLSPNEVASITKFNEGEFTDAALLKLLSKLNASFERYEPDKAVMTYLHQHARTLNFELDFKNPKERTTLLHNHPLLRKEADQKMIEANGRTMPVTSQPRLRMLKRQVPFPTVSIAGDQPGYKGVQTRIMHTTSVNSRINQPLHLIPTDQSQYNAKTDQSKWCNPTIIYVHRYAHMLYL